MAETAEPAEAPEKIEPIEETVKEEFAPKPMIKFSIRKQIWAIKETLVIIFAPLWLLPIPIFWNVKQGRCAYVILIMIVYWMTEVIPMAVTALLPIVLFPWLGVQDSRTVCINYLKDANMLFFGGLLVAVAVEKWNLHKRVALRVLMLVGSRPKWIIFGFMVVTAFLSMWLNNTATTAMMMPIAQAVLTELDSNRKNQLATKSRQLIESKTPKLPPRKKKEKDPHITLTPETPIQGDPEIEALEVEERKSTIKFNNLRTALKLAIPFSSTIGGIGTLIGSGPNIVLKGQLETFYTTSAINFTNWMILGCPMMVVDLMIAWILTLLVFLGFNDSFRKSSEPPDESAGQVIHSEYVKLGKMSFAEKLVGASFLVLAFLWVTREPEFVSGWGDLLAQTVEKDAFNKTASGDTLVYKVQVKALFVTDASVAITICVLLFILPSRFPNYLCFRKRSDGTPPEPAPALLDWPTANRQMPWSVILLLGGGFALADACKVSKLSDSVGEFLVSLKHLPPFSVSMIMIVVTAVATQFTSNMATTTIMLPILHQVADQTCVNPIYLMLPVSIAASFAFMLPVGTPPNAIAYSYGDITVGQMMKLGVILSIVTTLVLIVAINTWGYTFFELDTWPKWAPSEKCSPKV